MDYDNILATLLDIWEIFSSGLSGVYTVLTTKFSDLLNVDLPFVSDILDFAINSLNIGDWNLITLMFGAGLPTLIILTILNWLWDFVTP